MNFLFETLKEQKIDYVIEDGTIIITDKNEHVWLRDLTELRDNIQFNNRGHVDLNNLIKMGSNIQFNNRGNISLYNLTTVGKNVQFNNGGRISFNKLTTLGSNDIQFNNGGSIKLYLRSMKCRLPNIPDALGRLLMDALSELL